MSLRGSDKHRKTVLHVVDKLTDGGTEKALVGLLQAWRTSTWRHEVVTLREAGVGAARLPDDVACRAIGATGRSWKAAWLLRRIVRRRPPAIVHARNTCTWLDALMACVPAYSTKLVLGFHGMDRPGPMSARQKLLARWGGRLGARIASVSRSGVAQLVEEARVPRDRITWLPNGVELDTYRPTDESSRRLVRQQLGLGPDDVVVVSVGSLTPVKGHDLLLRALASITSQVANVHLLLAGGGDEADALARMAAALGIQDQVHFVGPRSDVATWLGAMDVYACSSRYEGMSNSILEAMACGLPVVATRVGDNARLVRNGQDGWVVPTGSVDALAQGLRTLCLDPSARERLGRSAADQASRFSRDRMIDAYDAFYSGLVARCDVALVRDRHAWTGGREVSLPVVR